MAVQLACGHEVADEHQTHYCAYLRLDELLRLQPTSDALAHPDERYFITIHQVFELWFAQTIFDLRRLIAAMDADNVGLATWLAQRVARITSLFTPTIELLEMMAPGDFFAFRAHLEPASGSESEQFREIEFLAGLRDPAYRRMLEAPLSDAPGGAVVALWTERLQAAWDARSVNDALTDLLARRGVAARDLYVTVAPQPNPHVDVFLLAEALLDFDERFTVWRAAHARSAERAISAETHGTGHTTGVRYLNAAAARPHFFPALWHARAELAEP